MRPDLSEPGRPQVKAHEGQDDVVARLQAELADVTRQRDQLRALSASLTDQLHEIVNSRGWRWLMRYRRALERVRPWWQRRCVIQATQARDTRQGAPLVGSRQTSSLHSLTLLPDVGREDAATVLAHARVDDHKVRPDVVCFSVIDWEFRFQRPQQIMTQCAVHGHRVFYISPSRFTTGAGGTAPAVRMIAHNIYEVQLCSPRAPDVYGEVISTGNLLDSIAALRQSHDISAAVAFVMIPSWANVALEAGRRWGWTVVYDCMDEWENFPGIKPAVVAAEPSLVDGCDVLVVSAEQLRRKWMGRGRHPVLVRNGVDVAFFVERCRPNARLAEIASPVIGYFGAIANWFDVDLVAHVARQRPHYQFVLLGGVFHVDVSALSALPNVRLLGQQPYSSMPEYLYHFDVCLIPFRINPITDSTDPVKLYEYLSAGKPVVAVALPELAWCREHLYLAADAAEFLAQLDRAVNEDDPARAARRRRFAADHTWAHRYRQICAALTEHAEPASIVVVTYNNLPLTQLCLDSVLRNTNHPRFDVIVVDNASTDGTPDYLRYMAERHPDVRVILNTENHGFARATNQGLAQSVGRHLVLLNNDTVVPPGWLHRLLQHLRDPDVGLVGPVTNFVGNEAKVEALYRTWGEMEECAADRARRFDGLIADIPMLARFCVAMRRTTHEVVGPLDERFGIGMFEDDDYAERVRAAGLRVVCAADAFVHHVGQAAFRQLIAAGEYDALFAANRRAYETKWNTQWKRHQHAALNFLPQGWGTVGHNRAPAAGEPR